MRYKLLLLSFFIVHACFTQNTNYSKGLIFTSQEEMLGIPLASTPYSGNELPSIVDLSSKLPSPGHQGNQSSCVAWAVGYALKAYQEYIETNMLIYFSPAFIYNKINNGRDGGSRNIDSLNLVSQPRT